MDLVDYNQKEYEKLKTDLVGFSSKLKTKDVRFIPISALNGDNVVNRSTNMNWYEGSTLLHTLENIHIASDHNHIDCRFPIQNVIRPQKTEFHDFGLFLVASSLVGSRVLASVRTGLPLTEG